MSETHFGWLSLAAAPTFAIMALLTGALVGLMNGLLVAKCSVAPFIATLGTLYIARGTALLLSNGHTYPNLGGSSAHGNTGFPAFL